MNELVLGYFKGEICNRDGCVGIIDEHSSNGSCSCHINPPCSFCVDDRHFCPNCNWEGIEDQQASILSQNNKEFYQEAMNGFRNRRESFYKKYNGDEPIDKLEMRTESHTHFTQKVFGVFPEGTETRESIIPKVMGTFGGRFELFDKNKFCYIAYTD